MIIRDIEKGIPHIEDLPISRLANLLTTLNEYEITEKLDGAQILFGIDEHGFYTSRETKGGKRIYNENEYPLIFSNTYKRSAHRLLETALPLLKSAGMRPGDQVEAEVLYGELPNVVPYSADTNYLIFLRCTEGNVNIDRLKSELSGQSLSISMLTPLTEDGKTTKLSLMENNWTFSRSPIINPRKGLSRELSPQYNRLVKYLKESSGIKNLSNMDVESTPLNKRPDWCESDDWKLYKVLVKEKKEEIENALNEHRASIKETVLKYLVKNQRSQFGPLVEDGGWIEGVVLRHRNTGKMVKVVDKNTFGVVREYAWEVRNSLTEAARSPDSKNSFMGNLRIDMAIALGYPELGTVQAKNFLKNTDLQQMSEGLNFRQVQEYWQSLLESRTLKLRAELDKYEKKVAALHEEQEISENSEKVAGLPGIADVVRRRTLETFAQVHEQIEDIKYKVKFSKDSLDLFRILVGKHLGS